MDFVARKTKKLQALRGNHDDPADAPMMAEEDFNFFRRVISAGDAPPPLPRRPFGPNVGEYEDNILQMVLYDGAAGHENTAHSPKVQREETAEDRKQRKKRERDAEREKAKMTDKEVEELEKLVDEVKEQTRDRSRSREDRNGKTKTKTKDASPEKPGRLYSLLHRDKKTTATANDSAVAEVDREAADLAKVLEDLDLSSANNRAFSFSKNSQNVVQDFSFILKDLINGVPTAYDDLRTLLDDKDNSLNRTYKQLPPFVQKLIAGVPKKVEAQAMGMVNETQKAMGAKPSESGAGIMNIAQSFLGVATLKQLVTNPAGVKGALMTIMNALKLRFPAFLGSSVLMSLGVFSESGAPLLFVTMC